MVGRDHTRRTARSSFGNCRAATFGMRSTIQQPSRLIQLKQYYTCFSSYEIDPVWYFSRESIGIAEFAASSLKRLKENWGFLLND
jgi:hypothetical protein